MPELTDADRALIARAREALDAEHGYDAMSLAKRTGLLEAYLDEALRRLEQHGS